LGQFYILKNKKPAAVDMLTWCAWMEKNRDTPIITVGLNNIDNVNISTVFLGVDHNFSGHGAPLLFETMIFGGELNEECERYATWEEAERGHKRMVDMVVSTNYSKKYTDAYGRTHLSKNVYLTDFLGDIKSEEERKLRRIKIAETKNIQK